MSSLLNRPKSELNDEELKQLEEIEVTAFCLQSCSIGARVGFFFWGGGGGGGGEQPTKKNN